METSVLSSTIVVVISIIFFGVVSGTEVSPCTSGAPLPEVEIKDCETPPCVFYTNSAGIMKMKFKAPRYLENIKPEALAYLGIGDKPISYPLGQNDACDGVTNTPCPLAEGEYVEYTFEMFIYSIFPSIGLVLEFSLLDGDRNSEPFECFRVNLQLATQKKKKNV